MLSKSLVTCEEAITKALEGCKAHATAKNGAVEYRNICGFLSTIMATQLVIVRHMRDLQTAREGDEEAIDSVLAMVERAANGGKNDA